MCPCDGGSGLTCVRTQVVVKAVGALHNLSSDPLAIPIIRDSVCRFLLRQPSLVGDSRHHRTQGGVPPLVKLLSQPDRSVCGSAAGAIQVRSSCGRQPVCWKCNTWYCQNLSREPGVRELIGTPCFGCAPQLLSLTRRVDAAETNAVEALTALLVSADTPSQVRVHA